MKTIKSINIIIVECGPVITIMLYVTQYRYITIQCIYKRKTDKTYMFANEYLRHPRIYYCQSTNCTRILYYIPVTSVCTQTHMQQSVQHNFYKE